jgi:hypothetical protein
MNPNVSKSASSYSNFIPDVGLESIRRIGAQEAEAITLPDSPHGIFPSQTPVEGKLNEIQKPQDLNTRTLQAIVPTVENPSVLTPQGWESTKELTIKSLQSSAASATNMNALGVFENLMPADNIFKDNQFALLAA